jgi:5-(carboxyamino)imidazole ribonucleotide synthase
MKTLLPGSTVGVLGGGQLAKMLAQCAQRMGYRIHVYSDQADVSAQYVCHRFFLGSYEDPVLLKSFLESVDVVTFEFENVPVQALMQFDGEHSFYPQLGIFTTLSDRHNEKTFLKQNQFPIVDFRFFKDYADFKKHSNITWSFPLVVKTAKGGYDGKGQKIVRTLSELDTACKDFDTAVCVESFITIAKECSVIVARNAREIKTFGPIENQHKNHILETSTYPSQINDASKHEAIELSRKIASKLDLLGLMCVEFFVDQDNKVYVNEIAPRPHNSGHLTIEYLHTSQFEQQLRAVCGLPLGSFEPLLSNRSVRMQNILGEDMIKLNSEMALITQLDKDCWLHLYGKKEVKSGRKMGHMTWLI